MQRLRTRLRAGATAFPPATFALNFLTGALDSGVTFSRGSNATLVDSTGKITYAPANLLLQSQTFDNASWTKAAATVTANATAAPDGTSTADKLTPDVTSASHFAGQTVTTTAVAHTYSAYLKADGYSWAILYASGVNQGVYFDLANGVVGSSFIGAPTSSSITPVGNGWYLCSITFTATTGTAARVYASPANTVSTFAGDGTSGIFVWGAQLEPVTYQTTPGTYNATTAAAYYGPRFDYDPVTLAAKGLLIEEQRTNLVTYSEQFDNAAWTKTAAAITANTTVAPDGTTTADTITEDATAATAHRVFTTITVAAAAHTASVYVKAGTRSWFYIRLTDSGAVQRYAYFNVGAGTLGTVETNLTASITPAGNGWYRCSATVNVAATSLPVIFAITTGDNTQIYNGNGTGSLFYWGAQLEAGAFATSYIPTVASQVTRSADVATMTGTNFSSWYNQSEGTFVADFDVLSAAAAYNKPVITSNDGTLNNRILLAVSVSSQPSLTVTTGGVFQGTLANSAVTNNTVVKTALAYKVSDFAVASNGATPVTQATGNVPTALTRFEIGAQVAGATYLNGHIRQIAYYNTRLPDATLQALTA